MPDSPGTSGPPAKLIGLYVFSHVDSWGYVVFENDGPNLVAAAIDDNVAVPSELWKALREPKRIRVTVENYD